MKWNLFILIFPVFLVFSASCGVIVNNEKFDSAKWKNGDERAKGKMVYDLQSSKILIGKTQTEIVELLGKSDGNVLIESQPNTGDRFDIDTNFPMDIYFTIHLDPKTQKVVSTDIGD
jgi:hypothetical protein